MAVILVRKQNDNGKKMFGGYQTKCCNGLTESLPSTIILLLTDQECHRSEHVLSYPKLGRDGLGQVLDKLGSSKSDGQVVFNLVSFFSNLGTVQPQSIRNLKSNIEPGLYNQQWSHFTVHL